MWKLFWDLLATVTGLYLGYLVFLWLGSHVSTFGYFPLGIIGGLITLKIVATLVHSIELGILWLEWKIFHSREKQINDLNQ